MNKEREREREKVGGGEMKEEWNDGWRDKMFEKERRIEYL